MAPFDPDDDGWQEYKDDQLMGPPREEPDEPEPLDREELDEAIECIDDERVRSALRGALAELDGWRSREHRTEYAITDGPKPGPGVVTCNATEGSAGHVHDHPEYGTPWVRTVSTGPWERYTPPPF